MSLRCFPYVGFAMIVLLVGGSGCDAPSTGVTGRSAEDLLNPNDSETDDGIDSMWTKVLEPRPFEFPRDHGAHPEYQIEWWYYTGNLVTSEGRRVGYQLTFFRSGIQRAPRNPSKWTIRDLYTAHFALSDVEQEQFTRFERSSRAGLDWAGADEQGKRIWNGDWQLSIEGDRHRLRAREDGYAIELQLTSRKPPALHGTDGLSRKGGQVGNASYYYSLTRMETEGKVVLNGESFDVEGLSWMDHEFSSSFLEEGQQGWDWFSLQLEDGSEIMIYQIRRTNGSADTSSSGTLIAIDGSTTTFSHKEFQLTPLATWHSPNTDADYPIEWRFQMPERKIDIAITAAYPSQEMDTRTSTGIIYWEGCVDVSGKRGNTPVTGRGYMEMTGYAADSLRRVIQ